MNRKAIIFGIISSSLSMLPVITYAADFDQLQTAKQQNQSQQQQINALAVKLQNSDVKPLDEDLITFPKEPFRFPIKDFTVESGHSHQFKWLLSELGPYKGRLLGAEGIDALVKMLSKKMIAKGYVTSRIVVEPQNLKTGVLHLKVIPGFIEDIHIENPNSFDNWRTAFPCRPGDLLNLRDIEQGLEQIKRVPSQDATMELKSGSQAGGSIVAITVKHSKPWSMGLSVDDSGLETTGRLQATGNFALYNPTGLNDVFSYSYTKDGEHEDREKGTKNTNFSYSIPYGNYTFNVSRYYGEFYQQVPTLVPFESRGKTTTWDFGLQKVIHRDNVRKLQTSFKIIKRRKENYINGEEIKVQRLNTTAYQIGLMNRQYVGEGMLDGMVYFQKGMPWFGAEAGMDDHSADYMTTRYDMWGLNFYYGSPLKLGNIQGKYSFIFRGQYTNNVLYAADQFSIGGRYTVRGFSGENTLSGEKGYIARSELAFPLKKVNVEPYIGIDYGRVWGSMDDYQLGNSLAGAVVGIRGKIGLPMSYDVFIGTPLYKPDGFQAGKTAAGFNVYWQI